MITGGPGSGVEKYAQNISDKFEGTVYIPEADAVSNIPFFSCLLACNICTSALITNNSNTGQKSSKPLDIGFELKVEN